MRPILPVPRVGHACLGDAPHLACPTRVPAGRSRDAPHPLALLRARRERQRKCCAAEQHDEFAMAPAWQEKIERAAQKSPTRFARACARHGVLVVGEEMKGLMPNGLTDGPRDEHGETVRKCPARPSVTVICRSNRRAPGSLPRWRGR
jgi:hypothetical protein